MLVVLNVFGVRGRQPLTYRAASVVLVLEAALVVVVLTVVVAGSPLPDDLIALRLTPAPVLVTILWVAGLLLWRRASRGPGRRPATNPAADSYPPRVERPLLGVEQRRAHNDHHHDPQGSPTITKPETVSRQALSLPFKVKN